MKLAKYLPMVALLLAPFAAQQLNAQILQGNVAGSSALFLEAGQGVYNSGGNNCVWTAAKGTVTATDTRPGVGLAENGTFWAGWLIDAGSGGTSCANPGTNAPVYTYLNLDSTLGDRCLFAQPSCTISTAATAGTAGQTPSVLGSAYTDTALPAGVLAAFNNQPVTVAGTDILPMDARFATYQALALCGPLSAGTQFQGYGYGPGPVGQAIKSFYSTASFHVVDFNIFGNDPINTSSAIPAYSITPVGAQPVVVAVNTSDASGFGLASITNINRGTLGLIYGGLLVRTADVLPQAFAGTGATYFPITALLREHLSGTYNTFDHAIPNNKEIYRPQESGNCTTGTDTVLTNPMNQTRTVGATTGARNRVIGTGQMVSELQAVTDSIGYAFWSAGNFAGVTHLKYLTVDGVDPINDNYSVGNGALPPDLTKVTLSHVADGSYPIWSELRLISTSAQGLTAATALAGFAQAQVSFGAGATQPDFITPASLSVIHSHFGRPFINFNSTNTAFEGPRVCGPSSPAEDGGDVGGLVFSLQAAADYAVLKGNYNTSSCLGITSVASFGVLQ